MRVSRALLAAIAGWTVMAVPASATRLGKEACDGLKAEQAILVGAGVRNRMQAGPEWAKANLTPSQLAEIQRLIELDEQIGFRCDRPRIAVLQPPAPPPPAPPEGAAPPAEPAPAAVAPAAKAKKKKAKAATPAAPQEAAAPPAQPKPKKVKKPAPDAAAGAPPAAQPKTE